MAAPSSESSASSENESTSNMGMEESSNEQKIVGKQGDGHGVDDRDSESKSDDGSSSASSSSAVDDDARGDDDGEMDGGGAEEEFGGDSSDGSLGEGARRSASRAIDPRATSRYPSSSGQPVMLSKSWRIQSTHVPMYTGGKFVAVPPSSRLSIPSTTQPSSATEATSSLQNPNVGLQRSAATLVLLPVGGNVAVVDLRAGTVVSKLRDDPATGSLRDDDDDDYDCGDDGDLGHDPDSITAFDCTSSIIVTCSHNSIVRQYSIEYPSGDLSGESPVARPAVRTKLLKTIGKSGHTLPVKVVSFHPSGVYFATGSLDGSVRVWDVRGGYCTHAFRWGGGSSDGGVRSGVSCISWKRQSSNRDLRVAIGREDGSIVIHDLLKPVNAPPIAILHDHVSTVTCIEWLYSLRPLGLHSEQQQRGGDSNVIVSSGRDAVLNLWVNGRSIHTLPVYEQVEGMVVIEDHGSSSRHDGACALLATAGSKGVVRLWNVSSSWRIEPAMAQASGASVEARGGYVALQQYREVVSDLCYDKEESPAVRLIVANAEHQLCVLESRRLRTMQTLVGHLDDILDLRILHSHNWESADVGTSRIAIATNSAEIRLMNVVTANADTSIGVASSTTTTLTGHTAAVLCLDISPCDLFLISCGKDRTVRIWELDSQQCVAVATGHTEAVGAAAFSRKAAHYRQTSSDHLAFCVSVSVDRTLKRWNLPRAVLAATGNGQCTLMAAATVRAHEKDINMVTVAPNDSLVATASQDKTVKLWNATDLSIRATLKGHRRGVWDVQFSPVDRVVATASGDKTLKLWSLADYACVRTFQGHLSTVLRVRFLSCGLQLVSSGSDGLIKLWTVRTNECEATLDGHAHKVWALDVREAPPGGDAGGRPIMVSGGGDSRLVAWVDTTVEEAQARRQEAHENVLLDQQLAGHLRRKEYREALGVTLRRDKPLQAFKVLVSIIESDLEKDPNSNGVPAVRALARRWTDDELVRVLRYCREWNARARTCHVAMVTVNAVVSSIPLPKLAELESVPEVLAGILVYAERHRERLDRLRTSAYLLDYVLSNMGSLDGVEVASADTSADDFIEWEQRTMDHRLVLPPKRVDGRIQVGGTAVVGCGAGAGAGGLESGGVPMGVSSGESVETVTAEDSDNSSSSAEGG